MLLRNYGLQSLVHLATELNSMSQRISPNRRNHELLESHRIPGMFSTVEYIKERHGE